MDSIIFNTHRDGYGTDQVRKTMTVGELIEVLSEYDENTPVYYGNDPTDYGWYTYGGIRSQDIIVLEEYEADEADGD